MAWQTSCQPTPNCREPQRQRQDASYYANSLSHTVQLLLIAVEAEPGRRRRSIDSTGAPGARQPPFTRTGTLEGVLSKETFTQYTTGSRSCRQNRTTHSRGQCFKSRHQPPPCFAGVHRRQTAEKPQTADERSPDLHSGRRLRFPTTNVQSHVPFQDSRFHLFKRTLQNNCRMRSPSRQNAAPNLSLNK